MSHHQTGKNGSILRIVFTALVLSQPALAECKENAASTPLRLSPRDVSLLGKGSFLNFQIPELEPVVEYGSFFGLKITLKIQGGWNAFSGGDIKKGIDGMYDNGVAAFSASGVPIVENDRASGRGGIEVGGDLIYAVTPRFGIGIGAARASAWKESHLLFQQGPLDPGSFQSRPHVAVSTLRAGMFYSWPFSGLLAISVRGGPAFYSAEYTSVLGCNIGFLKDGLIYTSYFQKAGAKQLGFEGGLGLEFTPNPFVAIFFEVQGRYAKINDVEGDEEAVFFQDNQSQESASSGPVYIVDTAPNVQLDIIPPDEAVPGNARKATLDFSGFTYLAGLKFRL